KKGPPQFASPKPLPELSGDWRDDFLAIAKSQIGYGEASDGSTYFGNRSGITYGAWCTAFVSWCAYSAGMPKKAIPRVLNSTKYIEFYAPQDRFCYVKGGIDAAGTNFILSHDFDDIRRIKPSSIKPGDIVLFDTDRNPNDGPDHTAIFLEMTEDGRGVVNLSGNSNNSVNITTKDISTVYGICRPFFDKKDFKPDAAYITSIKNTPKGIKIKWDTDDDASGYELYAKKTGGDGDGDYEQVTDAGSVFTDRSFVFDDAKNGEKYSFYVKAYNIVSDEDISDRVYGKRSAKKSYVYTKTTKFKVIKNVEEQAIKIRWKKNSRCSGYQIQCSTDEDFDDYRSITVTSALTTHKTLSGLIDGETYYVRIRPYTRMKNRTYYGAWKKYKKGIEIKK
ncbi:MAG: fibronectin type III domain-containing protein, partial [Lachnospiraceae bacterium]|nr:fibronectin type III domain-containing protein [Lachnospiraceae bacterium]